MDSIANSVAVQSFDSLARETQSAAAQSTASIRDKEASGSCTGFLVYLNGQVIGKSEHTSVPKKDSFEFALTPTRSSALSSAATASLLSDTYKQAFSVPKVKIFPTPVPLMKTMILLLRSSGVSLQRRKLLFLPLLQWKKTLLRSALKATSVVDPLVPEQQNDSAILAQEAVAQDPPAIAQDAPAANVQPVPEAMSLPERVDNETFFRD